MSTLLIPLTITLLVIVIGFLFYEDEVRRSGDYDLGAITAAAYVIVVAAIIIVIWTVYFML